MAKNKENIEDLVDGNYFQQIKYAIQASEHIYPNQISKLVAICSLNMLVDKFALDEYMEQYDISVMDYKEWFETPAKKYDKANVLFNLLFGEEENDGK